MDKYQDILKKYWGYDDFRGIQRDIIESIGAGHDTLGLMPTGGGKSITFQVPALAVDGVCIVVTPLIALMKDQVTHLKAIGIKAAAIYSGMSRGDIVATLENAIFGGVKLLYVSPERLGSDLFLHKLKHMPVSFITVDEAHCISQWGYDFRPSYLKIADIRKVKPEVPVLALTATATPQVVDDIMRQLAFRDKNVFRMSFARSNLAYVVRPTDNKTVELVHILSHVEGSAIVYVRSREQSKDVAADLNDAGISATYYHAGLEAHVKDERQEMWQADKCRVMVATNAFGMGIDKPDVRVVVHMDCPDSVEAYFQEAGRAGRDGQKAYAVLLWEQSDYKRLSERVERNFPPKDYIAKVYEHLAYFFQIGVGSGGGHTFAFDLDKFCFTYHFFPIQVNAALQILQNAGYVAYDTDPSSATRLRFLLTRNELYRLDEGTPQQDAVITSTLRFYGGLFSDFEFIDLRRIARAAGLTERQVYLVLKTLDARHIVRFIPQRRMPLITYLVDRVAQEDVVLPPSAYEERKEQYARRVSSMQRYVTEDGICRSKQLLAYFGEKATKDCGMCDVCVKHRKEGKRKEREMERDASSAIMKLLADGARHDVSELRQLPYPLPNIGNAVDELVGEEQVHVDGKEIWCEVKG